MSTKILIVEDEAITAIDIKNTLESMDFEVVSIAFEGKEAIQKAEELKPDLILMDIVLKGEIDGIETASKIMNFLDIPIIYLTAFSDKKTLKRAKLTEPYGFLTKPFSHEGIINTIETALYKHELDKKLKESEEKFQLMYQDAPLPYQSLNESGFITEVNQAWLDTLGYSRDEVIGKWFGDFLNTNTIEKFMENFPKFKAKGEICNIKFEMKHKNGSIINTDFNGKISLDKHGNFQRTHCIFLDITKQIEAEKKLMESKKHYKQFFNNPLMGFALCKILIDDENNPVDFMYLKVNKTFENLTGLKREEVLNKKVTDILVPEEVAEIIQIYGKVALTGESAKFQYPVPSLGKYYEVAAFSPRKKQFIAFFTDITEHKHLEEELKKSHDNLEIKVEDRNREIKDAYESLSESEEKFREIFNKANDMITLVELGENGLPGRFLDVNDNAPKRLGYSKEEFSKMKTEDIIDPEYMPQMSENAKNLIKNGHARFEIVNVDKWGTKIPVEVSVHIFKLREKDVILAISHDIRERKQAEKQLQKRVEELRQFAYVASHDLQEPLRTIASFTQLLERRYKGQLDGDADEFIDFIVGAALRMKQQIQGLLEFSRVETKGEEFELVDMIFLLNQVIKCLNSIIEECKAEIMIDELPCVIGDAGQLQRVFLNLISNAIKFRKPETPPKIHVSAYKSQDGEEYVFSVQDNGIGIEEQYFDRIFTVFQQLHSMSEYKGTGIGLSIVKKIIERHGGHIWAKSEFGKGSTFYFTIPIKSQNTD